MKNDTILHGELIRQLLAEEQLFFLDDGDFAKLRESMDASQKSAKNRAFLDDSEPWRKLTIFRRFNQNLRNSDSHGVKAIRAEAQPGSDTDTTWAFIAEAKALAEAIAVLASDGNGSQDPALGQVRLYVIQAAAALCDRIGNLRKVFQKQGLLTDGRKNDLAKLAESLDYVSHILHVSLANWSVYRLTDELVPTETAKEWRQHCHTIGHITVKLRQWVNVMSETICDLGASASPNAGLRVAALSDKQEGKPAMSWKDVQAKLLELYHRGDAYTSQRELAQQFGVSVATINKAIKTVIDKKQAGKVRLLKGWAKRRQSANATHLDELVTDNVADENAPNPAQADTDDDVIFYELIRQEEPKNMQKLRMMQDAERQQVVAQHVDIAMRELIEQAESPEKRAELNDMNDEQRQKMARLYLEQQRDQQNETNPNYRTHKKP